MIELGKKILLLGFDSLTYKLLARWMDKLQGFRELAFDSGTLWGPLESTMPPLSPPAWTAIATGMRPEKTGIFNWFVFDKAERQLKYITSQNIRGLTFWDIAMLFSKMKVGLIRFPAITYPQYNRFLFEKTGGILISGMPIEDITAKTVYPEELALRLSSDPTLKIVPIVNIDIPKNESNVESIVRKSILKWHRVSLKLFKSEDWDIFVVVFTELDLIQHYFMGHMDPNYPHKEYLQKGYEKTIFYFYKTIDGILRSFLNAADGYDIIIVSDHGSEPVYYNLNMNRVLAKIGVLKFSQSSTVEISSIVKGIRDIATCFITKIPFLQGLLKIVPDFINKYVIDKFRNIWLKSTTEYVLATTNLDETLAISLGDFSNIYLLNGVCLAYVKNALIYVVNRIIKKLPENIKRKVIFDIIETKFDSATFRPKLSTMMPDIIVYGETIKPTSKLPVQPLLVPPVKTGDHTKEGVYLINSNLVRNAQKGGRKKQMIYNIAPTILAMLDLPIPNIVDGSPIIGRGISKVIDYRQLSIKIKLKFKKIFK